MADDQFQNETDERKGDKDEIRESERLLKQVLEALPVGVWMMNEKGEIVMGNPAAYGIWGGARFVGPDRYGEYKGWWANTGKRVKLHEWAASRAIGGGEAAIDEMIDIEAFDGERKTILNSAIPIRNSDKDIIGAIIVNQDITDLKRAERALKESEQRLQAVLDNSPALIYTTDTKLRFSLVNRRFETLFHTDKDQVRGKTAYDLLPEALADSFVEKCRRTLEERATQEWQEIIPRDDGAHTYLTIMFPLFDGAGELCGVCGISTDITEHKNLEEQLRQSQKMEAIGRLAGGIAHDFNNLLTAIIGYSQLVLSGLKPNDAMRKEVEEIFNAGRRAASLTSQLLVFSRRQMIEPKVLILNSIIEGTAKMLRRVIREDIELVMALDPALGQVKADPGQIEQVVMNLAVNAGDAMPQGGKLIIETANVYLDEPYTFEHISVKVGPYVMLSVSDTGHGMNADVMSHAFEPFFTTKRKSEGTELGLSTVYGIVNQNGGHIFVYSEPDKGSTFKIYLPRIEQSGEVAVHRDESDYMPGGSETVLLVEDDILVRDLASRVLGDYGYDVIPAAGGEEAIKAAEKQGGKIDLLLTDVVMPQMSGKLLASMIRSACPEIKVIFSSGYTDNVLLHHGMMEPGTAYLQKPFTPSALLRKVRQVLDAAASEGPASGPA